MNTYVIGILWLSGATIGAVLVVAAMRRWRRDSDPVVDMGVLSAVFSLAGMLFAIVAAFVFIDVWSNADEARTATYREAEAAQLVAWTAGTMPEPDRTEAQRLCREYLHEVATAEWSRADRPAGTHTRGWTLVEHLHTIAARNAEAVEEGTPAVQALVQARQERITLADSRIGDATWFALLVGAILAGLPILFFPFERALPQLALTATVASMITLLLFTIQQIEQPFGHGRVAPTAYQETLDRLPAA